MEYLNNNKNLSIYVSDNSYEKISPLLQILFYQKPIDYQKEEFIISFEEIDNKQILTFGHKNENEFIPITKTIIANNNHTTEFLIPVKKEKYENLILKKCQKLILSSYVDIKVFEMGKRIYDIKECFGVRILMAKILFSKEQTNIVEETRKIMLIENISSKEEKEDIKLQKTLLSILKRIIKR